MFNLEVDADHCYRVGEQGILVHNASVPNPCPAETMVLERDSDTVQFKAYNKTYDVLRTKKLSAVIVKNSPKGSLFDAGWPGWWYGFQDIPQNQDVAATNWRRGHILGDTFGGPGKKTEWNLVLQPNQVNNGPYRSCEYEIERALCNCDCVVLEVEIEYSTDPANLVRATKFWFTVKTASGTLVDRQLIYNIQEYQAPPRQCSKSPKKTC